MAVFLNGDAIPSPNERGERVVDTSFLLCFNAHDAALDFMAPDDSYASEWTAVLDTAVADGAGTVVVKAGEKIPLEPRSVLVLQKTE